MERQNLESQLKEALLKKAEHEASLELLKEQYEQIKAQKDQDDQRQSDQLRKIKESLQKKLEEMTLAKEQAEEKTQEINRSCIKDKSEFEK